MIAGDVVFWKDFSFYDGGNSNKLLVVLSNQRNGSHLVLRTTSQPSRHRQPNQGCHHSKGYFFIPGMPFRRETWVLLHDPYECDANELAQREQDGTARSVITLPSDLLRAIINCFKKSDDCSEHHLWLLE